MNHRRWIEYALHHCGVAFHELISTERSETLAKARQFVVVVLRETTDMSFPEIAVVLGRRQHSSAISAYQSFWKRCPPQPSPIQRKDAA